MSKELIERLRLMSADTYGNDAADALESLEADRDSWERQAGDRLDDVLRVVAERDALANRVYQLEQKNSGAAEIIAAMQETHAEDQAELKALREQEPVATLRNSSGHIGGLHFDNHAPDILEASMKLYARPVPARELTNEDIQRIWAEHGLDDCDADGFARAIERYLKGEGK